MGKTLAELFPDDPGIDSSTVRTRTVTPSTPVDMGQALLNAQARQDVAEGLHLGADVGATGGDRTVQDAYESMVVGKNPPPMGVIDGQVVVDDQARALLACRTHPFVKLSGTAGVGKTYVARQLAEDEGVVLAATTGIASINLGEGTTINALLKYFDTDSLKEAHLNGLLSGNLRRLRRSGVRKIILDEVSMLNGDQLTYLVRSLDEVNHGKTYDADLEGEEISDEMGLVLVGDFGQLPPVPDKDHVSQKSLPVKFAFDSPEWGRFADHTVRLTQIRRQDNQEFIGALHHVRAGRRAALDFFHPGRFTQQIDDRFEGTTIFAKNDAVERYNLLRLDAVPGKAMRAETLRTGKPRPDWKQIPDCLHLKEGALVMILANRRIYEDDADETGTLIYANGDLGTLKGSSSAGWTVTLQRTGLDVQVLPITRHHEIPLEVGRRKELVALYGREQADARINGKKEIIGSVTYMPLRCAYGCTVHKTQGLTLDRVQVNIRDPFFRMPGMLFVALSRARNAEGLMLVGDQRGFGERCTVNPRVGRWL